MFVQWDLRTARFCHVLYDLPSGTDRQQHVGSGASAGCAHLRRFSFPLAVHSHRDFTAAVRRCEQNQQQQQEEGRGEVVMRNFQNHDNKCPFLQELATGGGRANGNFPQLKKNNFFERARRATFNPSAGHFWPVALVLGTPGLHMFWCYTTLWCYCKIFTFNVHRILAI